MPFRRDDGLCLEYPGIVHKHRDLGMTRRDALAGLTRVGQQGEIGDDQLDARLRPLARDPGPRGFRADGVSRDDDDVEAGLRQSSRDPAPDASGRACDDGDGLFGSCV